MSMRMVRGQSFTTLTRFTHGSASSVAGPSWCRTVSIDDPSRAADDVVEPGRSA
jgi:hypothetical protein